MSDPLIPQDLPFQPSVLCIRNPELQLSVGWAVSPRAGGAYALRCQNTAVDREVNGESTQPVSTTLWFLDAQR